MSDNLDSAVIRVTTEATNRGVVIKVEDTERISREDWFGSSPFIQRVP